MKRLLCLPVLLVILAGSGPVSAQSAEPVLVGAGDIAACSMGGDEATAALIDRIDGTVFTTGDNAYPSGSAENFTKCYGPSWGRFKKRTYPSLGNHDYVTPYAQAYFDYFGKRAGPVGLGFYSYNLGTWHVIVLNSNIDARPDDSRQAKWLKDDLKAHPSHCTVAYWHTPLFSSRFETNNDKRMAGLWRILYDNGVDVVINGDVHDYERFAPMDGDGHLNPDRGIREFVVGTGGATLAKDTGKNILPTSQVRDNSTWGVLKLTLHPSGYEWEFIPVEGGTFHDSGSASCTDPFVEF